MTGSTASPRDPQAASAARARRSALAPAFTLMAAIVVWSGAARAQARAPEPASEPEPAAAPADATARAPRPGQANGVAVGESASPGERLRWLPQALLFAPRMCVRALLAPVRGSVWMYERYRLRERFNDVFFNDTGTFGVYPMALFETGFGLNAGAHLVHRDLFGDGEHLRLRVGYGGLYRQRYAASLDSGRRFGRLEMRLDGDFDIHNKDKFYGIGNADVVPGDSIAEPIDARGDDTAVYTRFHQNVTYVRARAKLVLADWGTGRVAGQVSTGGLVRSFGPPKDFTTGIAIGSGYRTDTLTGFGSGVSSLVSELELSYDSRRPASYFASQAIPATGWLIDGYASYTRDSSDGRPGYLRYGLDVQRFIDLYGGTRIVLVRALAESVTGGLDDVPFVDLPRLGGAHLLRGYPDGRFRDRAFTLGTVEYMWELEPRLHGFVFVDAGRVWRSLRAVDISGLDDWRVGFGGGLQLQTRTSFWARVQLTSSRDGALSVHFAFDPAYSVRTRVRR